MALKSFHAASRYRQRRWILMRRFVPHRLRWFYEGCIQIPGQLWYAERRLLYETVRAYKPETVFEVGTWLGGGSTYFIAQALYDNGFGTLFTIDSDQFTYSSVVSAYNHYVSHLVPHVNFHVGLSTTIYPTILQRQKNVDVLFLDGAPDPEQTVKEFIMFEPYLHEGSILIAHDWNNEKMEVLRPMIEASTRWTIGKTLTAPKSVGFAVCRFLGSE